jgi:UDP-3-O-[3-hydroxymyristoyl] glucosamine N-acyltransferase
LRREIQPNYSPPVRLAPYIARCPHLPFGPDDIAPWLITKKTPALIRAAIAALGPAYRRDGDTAIHASTQIEPGATIKGPAIIGPHCFVAASALLRGGVFLDEGCIIGPAVELKTD